MNQLTGICFATLLMTACNHDHCQHNNPKLTSEWRLTEQSIDPGDGSGRFHSVNSEKNIRFFSDGTVESNGDLCSMSLDSDRHSSGTYSSDNFIFPNDCKGVKLHFERDHSELIVYYQCIEPCREKYVQVERQE